MAVDGKLVSSPSDATGERPVGDALLVLPRR
jgi:exopolysaccharide biosynthesis protein